ncbi:hypothetical protein L9F63_023132, partial [Diploptera punctata]
MLNKKMEKIMQDFIISLCVIVLFSQDCKAGIEINEDKHVDVFLRHLFTEGSSFLNFPVLDPFYSPETIEISNAIIPDYVNLLNVNLTRVHITGLSEFIIHKLSVMQDSFEIIFNFNLEFPEIRLEVGLYSLDGVDSESESIEGNGEIELETNDVTIEGNLTIGAHPNSDFIFLQDMSLNIDIGSNHLLMSGLNDELVTGEVDLTLILPLVKNQIFTLLDNKINQNIITSMELLD